MMTTRAHASEEEEAVIQHTLTNPSYRRKGSVHPNNDQRRRDADVQVGLQAPSTTTHVANSPSTRATFVDLVYWTRKRIISYPCRQTSPLVLPLRINEQRRRWSDSDERGNNRNRMQRCSGVCAWSREKETS